MRNLTKTIITFLTAASVLFGAGTSFGEEKRTQTFDMKPGQKVSIELKSGGSIKVSGWDKSQAKVTYYDRMHDFDPYYIDIESHNRDGLKIVAFLEDEHVQNTNLHFDLCVPREIEFEFFTAGGGLVLEDVGDRQLLLRQTDVVDNALACPGVSPGD